MEFFSKDSRTSEHSEIVCKIYLFLCLCKFFWDKSSWIALDSPQKNLCQEGELINPILIDWICIIASKSALILLKDKYHIFQWFWFNSCD